MRMADEPDPNEVMLTFSIECVDPALARSLDFNYLLVRYGNNEQIEQNTRMADEERRLRNWTFPVLHSFDGTTIQVEAPIKVHKQLGTEFKMFVDVDRHTDTERVNELLKQSNVFADVTPSLNEHRIFLLLGELHTTVSPEGFRNNFFPSSLGADEINLNKS